DQGDELDDEYRHCILSNLLRPERRPDVRAEDYIADCIRLAASNRQYSDIVADCRASCSNSKFSEIFEREWSKLFAQQDWISHDGLPGIAFQFSSSLNPVALCMADSSAEVRRWAVCNVASRGSPYDRIKLVLTILDDSNIEV